MSQKQTIVSTKRRAPKVAREQKAKDPIKKAKHARRREKIMTKRQMANNVQFDQTTSAGTPGIALANPEMVYTVPIDEAAISAPAAAIVSFALSRGWQEYTQSPEDPVQAYRWISYLLGSAAQNVVPQSATGPYWLALMIQALVQKNIPSRGGSVAYSGTINLPDGYPSSNSAVRDIGPLPYARKINFGVKTATLVNGYFFTIDTNIPYDATEAERAFTSLYNFLARQTPGPMHKKVSLSATNEMTQDPSAFAVPYLKGGNGDGAVGGFYFLSSLEIPIKSPLFSCFRKDPGAAGDPGRAPNFAHAKGGDGFTLGGMLVQALDVDQIHFKTNIRFKAVDFLEFFEVLCAWVSKVQQLWANDPDNAALNPLSIQCPLTFLETQLLFRGNYMPTFASSQHYAQSLYPRVVASSGVNEFMAFTAGYGTCAYAAPAMRLPRLLKENMQGVSPRVNYGSRGGESQPLFYTPVLGKYYADELNPKDFTFSFGQAEPTNIYLSFKDPSNFDAKLKRSVSVEDPINIIDGTTSSAFVCINDPGALGKLNVLWNGWIDKIINYTTPVATNTNDGGVNALRTIGMTHHWLPIAKQEKPLPAFYQDREEKGVLLVNSPYSNRRLEAVTNQSKFLPGVWEGILSKLIKPVNLITPVLSYGTQTNYTSNAAANGEFNTIVYGDGEAGGMTLAELHEVMASSMIKGKYGVPSELEKALNALDARGEAGILSSLAGLLLGPGVGGVVDSLGLP